MATSRSELSSLIALLRIFSAQIGAGNAWTVEEIWQALRYDNRRPMHDIWFDRYWHQRGAGGFDTPQLWLTAILQSLAELGLVALDDSPEGSSGFQRWRIGDSWRPPEPPSGGDGGGGDVGRPADGGDDDDGGGGLREALGHPVLLALAQDDFDELVNGLFGEALP